MAAEDRIDADEEWFVGEDKTFRFRFPPDSNLTDDIVGWTMRLMFHHRNAAPDAEPLLDVEASGVIIDGRAFASAGVSAAESRVLGGGYFRYVLWRTDAGSRAVLSYGPVEIREVLES